MKQNPENSFRGFKICAGLGGGLKDAPVDAVIVGIVDTVDVLGNVIYSAKIN